jgi:hypothetical protein
VRAMVEGTAAVYAQVVAEAHRFRPRYPR